MHSTETSSHVSSSNGLQTYQIFLIIIGAVILILLICSFIWCAYCKKNIGPLKRKLNKKNNITQKFPDYSVSNISKIDSPTDSNASFSLPSDVIEKNIPSRIKPSTNPEDTVNAQSSFFLELDSNISVEPANQVINDELIKLMEDENVNRLNFQQNNKTYAFDIEDMEYLGSLEGMLIFYMLIRPIFFRNFARSAANFEKRSVYAHPPKV
jgi:hypothetical protein